MGAAGTWSIGGHEVALTNLDKVIFPDAGLTKRDLIRYDVTMAPAILPYLRDRGLTLTRYPNGTGGPHFWEKEVPKHAPAWLARWHYESPNPEDSHTYAVADRVAALAFLANQAAIELHPWTSRTEAAPTTDLCAHRHRSRAEDDLAGGARPGSSLPNGARAPRRCVAIPR